MSTAEQPALDLGEYRGRNIIRTFVKLLNSSDGFHPATDLDEPRIFEIDEEITVAIRIKVSAHHPKLIDKGDDAGALELGQDFKCGTIAIIPDKGPVKTALDAVERRRKEAEAAREAAKPKRKVRRGNLRSVGGSLEEALQQEPSAATDDGADDEAQT